MNEKWKPVVGFEGLYSVSSLGRVRSESRVVPYTDGVRKARTIKSRLLSPSNMNGYVQVCLYRDNKRKTVRVHRLVAMAFIPNTNKLPCVNHKDGNKANNTPSNLMWSTVLDNNVHAYQTGLNPTGEDHHNSILTNDQIVAIRESYTGKWGEQSALARRYNVTPQTIHFIVHNKSRRY